MNEKQWENLQKFSAYKPQEKKIKITGLESFFIAFFSTFFILSLIVAFVG